jgi:uncharacterized membrane protein
MGIGAGLAFIAIGAVLAFATHFTFSGIDIQTIGWILMIVGAIGLLLTLAYFRPRRRRLATRVVDQQPAYIEETDATTRYPVVPEIEEYRRRPR